jgi:hypothetical protein
MRRPPATTSSLTYNVVAAGSMLQVFSGVYEIHVTVYNAPAQELGLSSPGRVGSHSGSPLSSFYQTTRTRRRAY